MVKKIMWKRGTVVLSAKNVAEITSESKVCRDISNTSVALHHNFIARCALIPPSDVVNSTNTCKMSMTLAATAVELMVRNLQTLYF